MGHRLSLPQLISGIGIYRFRLLRDHGAPADQLSLPGPYRECILLLFIKFSKICRTN
jgi:hypothetical protein